MSDWPLTRLDELIDVKHGFAFKGHEITTDKTECVLVTPGNFAIGGGWKDSKKYLRGYPPNEYEFSPGDLVVTMTDLSKETDTLGYSAKIPNDGRIYAHNQRVGRVVIKGGDPEFLYWLMRTREYQWHCVASASGTAVMHTSPSRIKEFEFKCPPLGEQEAIAKVLSSLEDKIDLLKRQNKTLEGMAEVLFRQWFIEEAQDDWPEVELRDIAEIVDCLHSKKPEEVSEPYGLLLQVFNISNDGSINLNKKYGVNETDFKFWTKRIKIQYGDIIISKTGRVGARGWVHSRHKFGIGRNLVALRALDSQNMMFLRGLMMSDFMNRAIKESTSDGTILQSLHVKSIERISFRMPTEAILNRIDVELKPIIERVTTNLNEIETLGAQRDTLLPKLMSGEVRVQMD